MSASKYFATDIVSGIAWNAKLRIGRLPGQELASKAKVKIDDARATALKARPGAISTEELEKEKGGSGLRYSFGVKSGKALYEVGVDAQTGKVLENTKEGEHPD